MIEDLLDVTRIRQAGGLALKLAPANLADVVRRTVDELQTGFPEGRIEATLAGDLDGVWDAERLCQVAANLVGNAIHHGDPASPVQVRADGTQACTVVLSVANGGTIDPGLMPYLFNPFRGREREPGRHQGLGLGLFIAEQIVRAHHGRIGVSSQDGTTCFRIELPRVPPPAPHHQAPPPAPG